jgi:hypothetical protein
MGRPSGTRSCTTTGWQDPGGDRAQADPLEPVGVGVTEGIVGGSLAFPLRTYLTLRLHLVSLIRSLDFQVRLQQTLVRLGQQRGLDDL